MNELYIHCLLFIYEQRSNRIWLGMIFEFCRLLLLGYYFFLSPSIGGFVFFRYISTCF